MSVLPVKVPLSSYTSQIWSMNGEAIKHSVILTLLPFWRKYSADEEFILCLFYSPIAHDVIRLPGDVPFRLSFIED